ncbi:GNAT family N-acetyltransferase [Paenibacillus kobensis]|uniref:GNAT family N-acetyltransferase n=1 Tax=Paenibacillus kobensis TaxID=59841 RepID=UPI001C3FC85F|nr:GNAT family N-acetyltransferase [Paenibacillus kobensis]
MKNSIIVQIEDPNSTDAARLMNALSDTLQSITGDSGRNSFDVQDVSVPRSLFVLARDQSGEAIGCGAIRPINDRVAEVKRMYAGSKGAGVGSAVLSYLEQHAALLDYSELWLETRLINQRAVSFYENRGYHRIANYGKYAGNEESVCFGKRLASNNEVDE